MLDYTTLQMRSEHVLRTATAMAHELTDMVEEYKREYDDNDITQRMMYKNLRIMANAMGGTLHKLEVEDDALNAHATWMERRNRHA